MSEEKIQDVLRTLYAVYVGLDGLSEHFNTVHKQSTGSDDSPIAALIVPNIHLVQVVIDALEAELPEGERP